MVVKLGQPGYRQIFFGLDGKIIISSGGNWGQLRSPERAAYFIYILKINVIFSVLALRICGIKPFDAFKPSSGAEICLQDNRAKTANGFVFVRNKNV